MAKQVPKGSLTRLKVNPLKMLRYEPPELLLRTCSCGFEWVGASLWERIKHWFRCL